MKAAVVKFWDALVTLVIYAVIGFVVLLLAGAVISGVVNSSSSEDDSCSAAYHRVGECP